MTRRATMTQAQIARVIRAAKDAGAAVVEVGAARVYLDPSILPQTAPVESDTGENTCDGKFGRAR